MLSQYSPPPSVRRVSTSLWNLFSANELTWATYKTFQVRHSMRYAGEAQVVMEMVVSTV